METADIKLNKRIYSIDLLRGIIMVIMALDHTRDFIHSDAFLHDPLDIETTSLALYFTRWITHFCAPIFIFLSGVSIYLQTFRKSKIELSKFLFKRGLWLIFVEFIIMGFLWSFNFQFPMFFLQVIWAIGISMVFMSVLIHLPYTLILITGTLIVCLHNVLDGISSTHQGFFWDLLHNGHFAAHSINQDHTLVIVYPFLPWLGVMMLGYCLGKLYQNKTSGDFRRKFLLLKGIGLILFFVMLRWLNVYGDPIPWSTQNDLLHTLLSFFNVNKYPPSLLFLCITIGPALIVLSLTDSINSSIASNNKLVKIFNIYGSVPFFYYILHFYLIHIIAGVLYFTRGHAWSEPDIIPNGPPFAFMVSGEGYSLGIVYLVWILVVISLYPLCKWFSNYRKRNSYWWLGYI